MESSNQSLVRLIVLIFFLAWTFLLGSETLAIQQSCAPMIRPVQQSDVKAFSDRCKSVSVMTYPLPSRQQKGR
jgi:hypothetical protein